MRVNSVSGMYYTRIVKNNSAKNQPNTTPVKEETNFKGKFGAIVGGTLGTGAILVASFVAAPAAICLAGAGLMAGMVAGDVAEDKINKEGEYKDKDNKKSSNG